MAEKSIRVRNRSQSIQFLTFMKPGDVAPSFVRCMPEDKNARDPKTGEKIKVDGITQIPADTWAAIQSIQQNKAQISEHFDVLT